MINQSISMDPRKTRRFGKYFNTIDFEVTDVASKETIDKMQGDTIIGKLHIGGKTFDLTLSEVEHLQETLSSSKSVFSAKYRLGRFGK